MIMPVQRLMPRTPRTWLVIAGALLIVVIVAASVHRALSVPSVSVKTAAVEQRLFEDNALVSAMVESAQQEQIVAPFGARLLRYDVAEGDQVKAGQVLAELDTTDVEKQAREAEAALAVAVAQQEQAHHPASPEEVAQAETDLTAYQAAAGTAGKKLERCQFLLDQGAASKADLEAAQTAQARAQADLQAAVARLAADQNPDPRKLAVVDAQAAQARVAAEDFRRTVTDGRLTASFDGVVLEKIPQEGSYLAPGAPVLAIASPNQLQLVADLSEQDIGGIAVGQSADVQWAGQPDKTWQATVIRVAPAVTKSKEHETENVVEVYLGFAQNPAGLLAGATVDATIHRIVSHQALVVPNEALRGSGPTRTAFVVTGNRARQRTVKIGYSNELYTEVLSGVNKGERVVLDPKDLQDGQPVKETGGGQK